MIRLPALTLLLSIGLAAYGQNLSFTFSPKGAATQIDSITATNLATEESIALPGSATLFLTPKTGITSITEAAAHLMIFPNPFFGTTTLIAGVTKSQTVYLKVQNLTGQTVAQAQELVQPGDNEFILSVSAEGIYLVSLTTSQGTTCHKVISTGAPGYGNGIRYLGPGSIPFNHNNDNYDNHENKNNFDNPEYSSRVTRHLSRSTLKSSKTIYALGYSAGDTILYLCRGGKFAAIFTDSPMESKDYEVEFPPIASFTIEPAEGTTETKFKLDATASDDAETPAEELEFRWDLDGDGNWDTEYAMDPYSGYKFNWAGSYTVILEVRDAGGLTGTATVAVNIVNASEGTFTDPRDGTRYPYKTYGTQAWMTKNLAWLPEVHPSSATADNEPLYYVNGYEGTSVTDAKATSVYPVYGALYNFEAAKTACPAGWHTPSDQEWITFERFLGMPEANTLLIGNDRGSAQGIGDQLRETGMSHWGGTVNLTSTNTSGFSAIGGGARDYDPVGFIAAPAIVGFYWTSTENDAIRSFMRALHLSYPGVPRFDDLKVAGFSVRCIRD